MYFFKNKNKNLMHKTQVGLRIKMRPTEVSTNLNRLDLLNIYDLSTLVLFTGQIRAQKSISKFCPILLLQSIATDVLSESE